ncbi:MAG: translation initiation factor IF-3 [Alphaproteobacteria bacterium]|nr:translation initiation factor IF-3 [Alphaproteobacteria bacterium]
MVRDKRRLDITRRSFTPAAPVRDGLRANGEIVAPVVHLIDAEGVNHGNINIKDALQMATESDLDLIEISPNANPPVCKILDHGKYKYHAQKKASETRKKQKVIEIKEIKMRPNIDSHDYDVKIRSAQRFFQDGDRVKISLRFRGREMAHPERGVALLEKIREQLSEVAKSETDPRLEGRQMIMIMVPRTIESPKPGARNVNEEAGTEKQE